MLLLIDAGNTRVKWALADDGAAADDRGSGPPVRSAGLGRWGACGAVLHADVGMLARDWADAPVRAVLIANVAGADMRAALLQQVALLQDRHAAGQSQQDMAPPVHWFASADQTAGVRNGYRRPEQLGCDRFAALIGACALLPQQALIVAVCGTATTVDALTAAGAFIGGMILPGPGLMAASLARNTAQLPAVAMSATAVDTAQTPRTARTPPTPPTARSAAQPGSPSAFADNTDDAITSGCLSAQAGAIERAVAAHGGAHCLLSGGAAALVGSCLAVPFTAVDNLVLIGLQVFAASSDSPCKGI